MFYARSRNVDRNPVTRAAAERVARRAEQKESTERMTTRRQKDQVLAHSVPARGVRAVEKKSGKGIAATKQERPLKLTAEQRSQIIRMLNAGRPAAEIARLLRIHRSTVGRIGAEARSSSIADWF